MKWAVPALLLVAAPAAARDALGIYDGWGAFRDAKPQRCFAIAEPVRMTKGQWRPYASVGHWPMQRIRGQLHIRMSREKRDNAPVTLSIDDRKFALVAGGADAWAPDARADAAIVAAMRSGRSMSIASVSVTGAFADTYRLKGAATAIDAAALGCARGR